MQRMLVLLPLQLGVDEPMPVQLSCTESLLSELDPGPVAVSIAPPVFSELLQPRPGPDGALPHGHAITPDVPGWQVTVPCASAELAVAAARKNEERNAREFDCIGGLQGGAGSRRPLGRDPKRRDRSRGSSAQF